SEEIYNRHRATPDLAESVTFPKSAVTFAEIRTTVRRSQEGRSAGHDPLPSPDANLPRRQFLRS
ncbi:hypothetical protein, partial [Paraburkholderia graminis]|uniref:hypothetical protein n=1 Tax=Paraburkholderia graminis TaxID=60548 RepID=UPI00286C4655